MMRRVQSKSNKIVKWCCVAGISCLAILQINYSIEGSGNDKHFSVHKSQSDGSNINTGNSKYFYKTNPNIHPISQDTQINEYHICDYPMTPKNCKELTINQLEQVRKEMSFNMLTQQYQEVLAKLSKCTKALNHIQLSNTIEAQKKHQKKIETQIKQLISTTKAQKNHQIKIEAQMQQLTCCIITLLLGLLILFWICYTTIDTPP